MIYKNGVNHVNELAGMEEGDFSQIPGLTGLHVMNLKKVVAAFKAESRGKRTTDLSAFNSTDLELVAVPKHVNPMRAKKNTTVAETAMEQGGGGTPKPAARVRGALSLHSYDATRPEECSMEKGDDIEVLAADDGSGWTRIRNCSSGAAAGLVPTTYLTMT